VYTHICLITNLLNTILKSNLLCLSAIPTHNLKFKLEKKIEKKPELMILLWLIKHMDNESSVCATLVISNSLLMHDLITKYVTNPRGARCTHFFYAVIRRIDKKKNIYFDCMTQSLLLSWNSILFFHQHVLKCMDSFY
jgi:hypothetical protein